MRQSEHFLGGIVCAGVIAACSGFDPAKLAPPQPEASEAGVAGYSYDGASGHAGRGNSSTSQPSVGGAGSGATTTGAGDHSGEDVGEGGGAFDEGGTGGDDMGFKPGAGRGGSELGGRPSTGSNGSGGKLHGVGTGGVASASGGTLNSAGTGGVTGAGIDGIGNGGESGMSNAEPRELFFSEYVEGSGSYKALEIRALATTNLLGCELATYSNGSTSPNTIALDAKLHAGAVYVLCTSSLGTSDGVHCDRLTSLSFNGNDAVALECDGVTLDVIGQIGVDPGDAWTNGDTSTANQTLRRRCGIASGDANGTDAFDPSVEWIALPEDTFDGLGDPACG
jgi:hypothetical protein